MVNSIDVNSLNFSDISSQPKDELEKTVKILEKILFIYKTTFELQANLLTKIENYSNYLDHEQSKNLEHELNNTKGLANSIDSLIPEAKINEDMIKIPIGHINEIEYLIESKNNKCNQIISFVLAGIDSRQNMFTVLFILLFFIGSIMTISAKFFNES
ncbi:hypothetical protein [uncultured Tolumonas sp.]|uniref:hypothetical protein n=1 Tax=uncultured Tolumonas sp. TaxID=263765 RepID=UPI00293085F4|nr:hypothetical protein [uncultured Tolumonas sp.]